MILVCSTIKFPLNKSNKCQVADLVISLLASEWPLSIKSLHYRIKRRHALEVSFQAVYKAVKKLRDEGIVSKEESLYLLNYTWVDSLNKFSSEIRKNYLDQGEVKPARQIN